ncbi:hypothetical protein POF50_021970 [Streptomyces sp. SL13]|uniref:Protein kinase domain-containing protein n=1 Tax=Streptantibioticus silvisoli TaxID=2705255 RepID=A0AA90KHK7_9ACTN|nr:hypothetical protein [Streptantibioticus silvisoli]MDI5966068.1 hypothetical protein [Streptantibioticus silvisoli]MDI5971970.1 hypothetical protein [Streptantibioticus silvisoli]
MPTAHIPALHLAEAAAETLGLRTAPEHVTGRKGADIWHLENWAVKTAVPGARGHLDHEAAVYDLLHRQGLRPGSQSGYGDAGRWLAIPWLDGSSIWDLFAPARNGTATPAEREGMRRAADAMFDALHQLHAAGWLHGDVQPENAVVLPDGHVEFIDYDLAHHPDLPLPFPYRAGLVHVISPHIARQLAATGEDEAVTCTPQDDRHAAGAGLSWAWTGHWPTAYRGPDDGPHADLFQDIAAGRRRDITADRPWPDPHLEGLITAATRGCDR